MATKCCYYIVLVVYILLCICQFVACHLTHSLIILTDSYINLYKILDVALGILHLRTQKEVRARRNEDTNSSQVPGLELRLFGRICTYKFRRLPLLGSFVNGLFLAALLMSAAIEGIQTCFHASHQAVEGSILREHPLTYPIILVGFALVGLVMQWCSSKAHQMREEELESESLLDVRILKTAQLSELNASRLDQKQLQHQEFGASKLNLEMAEREIIPSNTSFMSCKVEQFNQVGRQGFVFGSSRNMSAECLPTGPAEQTNISLKSLRIFPNLESPNFLTESSISKQVEFGNTNKRVIEAHSWLNWWRIVRFSVSPIALVTCALIDYLVKEELITEVADAGLSIMIVVLLFMASYPPMKKAGKVLLQTVPAEVEVESLKSELMSVSPLIVDIKELHVWSLTPRSNRVATCHLHLKAEAIESSEQLSNLIREVKFKFLDKKIKCSTIQPIMVAAV